jgi:hypothetical protein
MTTSSLFLVRFESAGKALRQVSIASALIDSNG